jgi:4-amino-4-deoxy-L-arabinose transferase-like glycosyltransferase
MLRNGSLAEKETKQQPGGSLQRTLPLLVAALVVLGLGARIRQYAAGASYWYDEAYLLLNVFDKNCGELLGPLRNDQAGPPIYFWTLRILYQIAGPSEWTMRLPAFLASVLALFVMIAAARRIVPHGGWLWAVGLCATCKQAADRGAEVKPYTWDFLLTLLILWAAHLCLTAESSQNRWRPWLWLLVLAVLGPWCSLPSVFVLGAVGLALFYRAIRSRCRGAWYEWAGFHFLFLASAASLYFFVLRQQRTAALDYYWRNYYGDASSPGRFVAWATLCLVGIGQYGSNGLGVPLLLFALLGGYLMGRRSPAHLIMLAGPFALGMAASLLHRYPLQDRLTFFLVPCLYLLAAEGIGTLAEKIRVAQRPRWLMATCLGVLIALLVPGIGPAVQMAVMAPDPGFREAFAYADRHRRPTDVYWVSHPQVYEVYFRAKGTCLGSYDDENAVVERARGRRLWLLSTRPRPKRLERRLGEAGFTLSDAYEARDHVALLYTTTDPR